VQSASTSSRVKKPARTRLGSPSGVGMYGFVLSFRARTASVKPLESNASSMRMLATAAPSACRARMY